MGSCSFEKQGSLLNLWCSLTPTQGFTLSLAEELRGTGVTVQEVAREGRRKAGVGEGRAGEG